MAVWQGGRVERDWLLCRAEYVRGRLTVVSSVSIRADKEERNMGNAVMVMGWSSKGLDIEERCIVVNERKSFTVCIIAQQSSLRWACG